MLTLKTYPCGLRLVIDYLPDRQVENVAFFVASGAGYDLENKEGIAHFYEHMFFKSTKNRSSYDVNLQLDNLGAGGNAYTGHDKTCYYSKVTTDQTEKLFELLSDCFFNGLFLDEEIRTEKGVVCSEIDRYQDDYLDCSIEAFNKIFFDGTSYSHPILGSKESVMSITSEDLKEYRKKNNTAEHLIISVAGGVCPEEIERFVKKYVLPNFEGVGEPVVYSNAEQTIFKPKQNLVFTQKTTEQVYLFYGCPIERIDNEKFILSRIGSILFGGVMSSRLFQRLREKEGLVYSVSSSVDSLAVSGCFTSFLITNKSNAKKAILAFKDEIDNFLEKGFSESELENGKTLLKANLKISNDNLSTRTIRNASYILDKGKCFDIDEEIQKIDSLALQDLNSHFRNILINKNYIVSICANENDLNVLELLK